VENLVVAEADDSVPVIVQALGPGLVILGLLVVDRPIHLDDELARRAIEIEYERAHRMLTPKA
jgi:hypothetical protein